MIVIVLPCDDPEEVNHTIDYFYNLDYGNFESDTTHYSPLLNSSGNLLLHAKL
jgi:hypothetical protein